jgi:1-acyl-sn-glycerol-3-phosphate acyltransferase
MYRQGYTGYQSTITDRIIQVCFFVIFFGWLRLILFVINAIIGLLVLLPLALFYAYDRTRVVYYPFVAWFLRNFCFPFAAACLSIYRIRWHGKPDCRTRCFIYNHTCFLDGPLVYTGSQFTIVITAGILKLPIVGKAMRAVESLFIDRRKTEGNSKIVCDAIANPYLRPLAVAPEAKISKGDYLFRFRTGAFLTDDPVQPMTIRYTSFLPIAGISPAAVLNNDLEWFWMCFCSPGAICDITYLDLLPREQLTGKSPRERADMVQVIMANALGTLASARSSHEIFGVKKKME